MFFPQANAGGSEFWEAPRREQKARTSQRPFSRFVDDLAPPHVKPQPTTLSPGTGAAIAILSQALAHAGE